MEVQGLANLQRALKHAERDVRLGIRKELRQVVEPIRRDAQTLTGVRIRRMHLSPEWTRMRVGVTQKFIYVAPRQKGVRRRGEHPLKRPNLAELMMSRAMEPALYHNQPDVLRAFEGMLATMAAKFNRS